MAKPDKTVPRQKEISCPSGDEKKKDPSRHIFPVQIRNIKRSCRLENYLHVKLLVRMETAIYQSEVKDKYLYFFH